MCVGPAGALGWPGRPPLSLQQALEEALAQNPELATSKLSVESAEAQVLSAQSAYDPQLSLNGTWSDSAQNSLFNGFIFDIEETSLNTWARLGGTLPTGTTLRRAGQLQQLEPDLLRQLRRC